MKDSTDKILNTVFDILVLLALLFNFINVISNLNNNIYIEDSIFYHSMALHFAKFSNLGCILKDTLHPPLYPIGYPLLLGLFYKLLGPSVIVGKCLNLFFITAAIFILYFILKRRLGSFTAAGSAATILLIFNKVVSSQELMAEAALYFFLFLSIFL